MKKSKKKEKLDPSQLTVHIGFWMRLVSNNVSYSFSRKLGESGVTVAEWVILREMYSKNDTTSPGHIAELTGLTRGAVSKLMTRLLDKKLITRKEASGDRRYQDVTLTIAAKSLVPKLAEIADENDEFFFSVLTKSERASLTDLLQKIVKAHQLKQLPIE